jgi:hypothetical protein
MGERMLGLPMRVLHRLPTTRLGSRAGSLLALTVGSLRKRKLAREDWNAACKACSMGWHPAVLGLGFAGIELAAHNDRESGTRLQWK